MNIFSTILDTLLPPACILCESYNPHYLCNSCLQRLPKQPSRIQSSLYSPTNTLFKDMQQAIISQQSISPLQEIISIYSFQHIDIKKIIHYYKYKNLPQLSIPLGTMLTYEITRHLKRYQPFALCPVPLHPRRQYWRGYNQSLLLAQHIANNLQLPLLETILRIKDTPQQMKILNRKHRIKNVDQCFAIDMSQTMSIDTYTPILIIDDVTTTLSTIRNLALTLQKAGFHSISAITLAH